MATLSLVQCMHEMTARKGARTGGFEFDTKYLMGVAEKIVYWIGDKLENNKKPGFRIRLTLNSPIDGMVAQFTVRGNVILDHERYMKAPAAQYSAEDKTIWIRVPDAFIFFAQDERAWIKDVYTSLIHELTHAFDVKGNKVFLAGKAAQFDADNPKEYYHDPAEVKAFLRQVISELEEDIELGNISTRNITAASLLGYSDTWQRLKFDAFYHDNPKIHKLFLRAAYDLMIKHNFVIKNRQLATKKDFNF